MSEQWWAPERQGGPTSEVVPPQADTLEVRRTPAPRPAASPGRAVLAVLSFLIAALLAPLALVAVWVDGIASDREHYVQVVADLAHDAVVQNEVVQRATAEVSAALRLDGAGPGDLGALADRLGLPGGLGDALQRQRDQLLQAARREVEQLCRQAVGSAAFVDVWRQASEQAYDQAVGVVRTVSESDAVARARTILLRLDLRQLLEPVLGPLARLGIAAASLVRDLVLRLSFDDVDAIREIRALFALARTSSVWLPILCLAFAVGGVLFARRRLRALAWASGLAALPLLGLWWAGSLAGRIAGTVVSGVGVSDQVVRRVADGATDVLVGQVRQVVVVLLVVCVLATAAAVVARRRVPTA
ncbi:MAG: hypothetical protein U0Q15_07075 [Kineosporiaceae bacterium]